MTQEIRINGLYSSIVHNPYKWPYKWVYIGFHFIDAITRFITVGSAAHLVGNFTAEPRGWRSIVLEHGGSRRRRGNLYGNEGQCLMAPREVVGWGRSDATRKVMEFISEMRCKLEREKMMKLSKNL